MLDRLKKLHQHAKHNGYILGAKLVRGAYMEEELKKWDIKINSTIKILLIPDFDAAVGIV